MSMLYNTGFILYAVYLQTTCLIYSCNYDTIPKYCIDRVSSSYFFLFLSIFLFYPIFKQKPPFFPIFLVGEAKIC